MSFIVVMRSHFFFTTVPNRTEYQYLINWDFFPESKYIMTMDFVSTRTDVAPTFAIPSRSFCNISIDGLSTRNYSAGSINETQTTQHIGIAKGEYQASDEPDAINSGILVCSPYDNPPIYLPYKPSSNILTVRFFEPNGITPYTRMGVIGFVLTLHFTPID